MMELEPQSKIQKLDGEINFTNLPVEITEKIFNYLTPRDLITVSAVCRQYYKISQSPTFGRKIFLKIWQYNGNAKIYQNVLQKSERKFFNLHIKATQVQLEFFNQNKDRPFDEMRINLQNISNIMSNIESIILSNLMFSYQKLWEILTNMPSLKSLKLIGCKVTTGSRKIYTSSLEKVAQVISNLTEIYLDCDINLNKKYKWFLDMVNLTSHLMKLHIYFDDFDDCICQKKRLDSINNHDMALWAFIKKNKYTLKELHIYKFQLKDNASVDKMKGLNLEKLILHFNEKYYNYYQSFLSKINLNSFLENHKNLIILIAYIDDNIMLDFNLLAENMNELVKLKLIADNICNLNLLTISKFKKLKYLEVEVNSLTSLLNREVTINLVLCELNLGKTKLTNNDICGISESCPNLELLKCYEISLTDDGLQSIIKHLNKLKHLHLSHIFDFKITDLGISGFNCETNEQTGVSIKQLENLESLVLDCDGKIYLSESCLTNNIQFAKIMRIKITCNILYNVEDIKTVISGNCPKVSYFNLRLD